MERLLIVCPTAKSSFVKIDAEILGAVHSVKILGVDLLPRPKILSLPFAIIQEIFRQRFSAVIMWFSIPHLAPLVILLAKMFRKKILAITGGYDVAFVPSIGWGEMKSPVKRFLQGFSLSRADKVVAFSDFSRSDVSKFVTSGEVEVLYQGIDTKYFSPLGVKRNLVVTTCMEINSSTIIQKGLKTFLECARLLPKYRFLIIGQPVMSDPEMKSFVNSFPINLACTGQYVPNKELLDIYRRAKVYVQASAHEGFGIACAEAMSCGCVPVGTLQTSLQEVIGDTGFLNRFGDSQATAISIRRAMGSPRLGKSARKRIVRLFDLEIRRKRLLKLIHEFLS